MESTHGLAVIDDVKSRNLVSVSWDTSSICNYRCSYCDETLNGGKHRFPEADKMIRFLKKLREFSGKNIFIEMKGGEPTLWKDISHFLKVCREERWCVSLVTNGSKSLAWWQEHYTYPSLINMSLHPEYFDLNRHAPVLEFLYERRQVAAMYLMHPPLFEKAKADVLELRRRFEGLNITAMVVAMPKSASTVFDYNEEQKQFILDFNRVSPARKPVPNHSFFEDRCEAYFLTESNQLLPMDAQEVKLMNQNRWAGWLCSAGLDRIHIATDGEIFRGQCMQGGLLGNLHTEDYVFPVRPVLCEKESCFCGAEMVLPKWDPEKISLMNLQKT